MRMTREKAAESRARIVETAARLFRENGILDRAGERHCADNPGEGGDGPPTPGGGGAPTEAREPLQHSAHA